MIHCAEAVLPGHPDKFCDRVADAIVAQALAADPAAFAQIEVGVWADQAWLSGNIVTRKPMAHTPSEILVQAGLSIGLDAANHIDATRYQVTDTVCQNIDDPTESRSICDDQCIVIGYAGYDRKTRYLPPEHFLVHSLGDGLWSACQAGSLKGCGPDGKVLVTMREEASVWVLETILVTLQQPPGLGMMDLTQRVHECLRDCYGALQASDARWVQHWRAVEVLVNPNGPYLRGGSDGDNGQTGRKLVMDYYGPRIPLGGGALAGKHPAHIDRMAARAARQAAVHAVQTGAPECTIRLAYAPNRNAPLQETWEMGRRGERQGTGFFNFDAMLGRLPAGLAKRDQGNGVYAWELPEAVEPPGNHPLASQVPRNRSAAPSNESPWPHLDGNLRSAKGEAA
jgi:S-adenosylmethionine synthetase